MLKGLEKKKMGTALLTAEEQLETNYDTLRFWRDEAGLHSPLALNVDCKVDAAEELTEIEQRILNLGLTHEQVQFVKANLHSL